MVNNVPMSATPTPGWSRPAGADGGAEHEHAVPACRSPRYAERLTATLPARSRSASSIRAARRTNSPPAGARHHRQPRRHRRRRGYHGNTQALIDVSPYKFDGPGRQRRAAARARVPMPDTYRGALPRRRPARTQNTSRGRRASASGGGRGVPRRVPAGCGGQIVLAAGYLAAAYRTRARPAACASPTRCRSASAASAPTSGASRRRASCPTSSPWASRSATVIRSAPW